MEPPLTPPTFPPPPPAPPFDPRNQTFYIASGPDGTVPLAIWMAAIENQRVRLANTSINYGVQLGLCLLTLVVVLVLLPSHRLRRAVNLVQVGALVVAVVRLVLLVLYFPGPLSGYYVAWTGDAGVLRPADYTTNTVSNGFGVVQLALVEAALTLQSRALVRTWPRSRQLPTTLLAAALAAAAVVLKAVWVVHHTMLVRGRTLPVPLDAVGEASVVLGAVSIFYFCGLFFVHLSLHVIVTRGVLTRPDRGLTSLEILAIGNGVLMLMPSLFAGLDIAAGPGNTKVLPFDAGSWVQTLVAIGLPLIGLVAFYRGSDSRASSRRVSLFANDPFRGDLSSKTEVASSNMGMAGDGYSGSGSNPVSNLVVGRATGDVAGGRTSQGPTEDYYTMFYIPGISPFPHEENGHEKAYGELEMAFGGW
ncbi:fungal pheromone mating factor STE2 GPCR-domain-containing protein [Biscogniauxia sp. FL1348]|nr:fungal pheromone mating factor STE2 GPCR-domain-containing protein [Biscogniauxia sp. FL1348]